MTRAPLTAIVWDYDGTLVDTRLKNFRVARRIVAEVSGRPAERFAALRSIAAYEAALRRTANWRELYGRAFGFSEDETDGAGALWTGFQLEDETPVAPFDGIAETLAALAHLPHGIVSQNARTTIARALEAAVGVRFGAGRAAWAERPDYEARHPRDVVAIVDGLSR